MPNQNIREQAKVLQAIKDLMRKKIKSHIVYQCPCCAHTLESQKEIILHALEKHTLKEIFESL